MIIKKGIATKVRSTVEISGGGNDGHVTTTHISLFQIEGQQIKIKSNEPPIIDENDTVAVAGRLKSGIFSAYAYKNLTTGVSGNEGMLTIFLFGLIMPAAGIFAFYSFSDPFFGIFPKVIGAVFIFFGLYMFNRGMRIREASGVLESVE
jgi:hypothetical protein